jgi:hypothetical protein
MYITPRLFSLEYCRQRLASNHLLLFSKSKRASFNLPGEFSSFLIKRIDQSVADNINKLFFSFGMKKGELWKYDPHHIIS